MRRSCLALLAALVLAVTLVTPSAAVSAAGAQGAPPTGAPAPDIVPRPNAGHAPEEAGDRGGALQLLVLGLVVVAVAGATAHIVRQSRRARDRQSAS